MAALAHESAGLIGPLHGPGSGQIGARANPPEGRSLKAGVNTGKGPSLSISDAVKRFAPLGIAAAGLIAAIALGWTDYLTLE